MRRQLAATVLAAATAVLTLLPAAPASARASCTAGIGGGCGPYHWAGWPGSNGFNTYVIDQAVNVQTGSTGHITARSPSSWQATASYASCGGCVQTFTAVQQLTNNWGGGGWNGSADTPVSALAKLQVRYAETAPSGPGNQYEFAPDIWTSYSGQLGPGTGDVMMWADTTGRRCTDNGLGAGDIIGHAALAGQPWTVYRYGPAGGEIVFIRDGGKSGDPAGTGTCATAKSGTLHVLSALKWLSGHAARFPPLSRLTMSQLNTGWEITDGGGAGYAVTALAYPVAVK